jgi:hypothetical protein
MLKTGRWAFGFGIWISIASISPVDRKAARVFNMAQELAHWTR